MTLVGNPHGKIPFGILWYRWEDSIKIYLAEMGCEYVKWKKCSFE
jgi:hypothetical protein